jgi:hypothetical protein
VRLTRESIAVASDLEKIDALVTYDDRVDQIDRRESSADGALRLGSAAPALLIAWTQRSCECARRKNYAGVAKESGGIEWSFGRKRGLEI